MTRLVLLDPAAPDRIDRMRPFLPEGWELTTAASRDPVDQLAALKGARFAITGDAPVTAEMFAVPGLEAVHKWGVGYDNIDLDVARAAGVRVLRTTGSNAVAVAETTLGMILALGRNLVRGHMGIVNGEWLKGGLAPSSTTLDGKTVGIVGLGHIGAALAKRLRGFDCKVLYTKRSPIPKDQASALGVRYAPLAKLLATSDVVTLNCELNDSTRAMIDAAALASMKPGAFLVNLARGGIVVEADLAQALRSGHLAGAATDVFGQEPVRPDNPLLNLDRVILTPHIGAVSSASFTTSVQRMIGNLYAISRGEAPSEIDVLI